MYPSGIGCKCANGTDARTTYELTVPGLAPPSSPPPTATRLSHAARYTRTNTLTRIYTIGRSIPAAGHGSVMQAPSANPVPGPSNPPQSQPALTKQPAQPRPAAQANASVSTSQAGAGVGKKTAKQKASGTGAGVGTPKPGKVDKKTRSRLACVGCKATKQKCDGPSRSESRCVRLFSRLVHSNAGWKCGVPRSV